MKSLPSLLFMSCILTVLPFSVNATAMSRTNQVNVTTMISFPTIAIKAPSRDAIRAEHTLKVDKQSKIESGLHFIPGQGAVQQNMTNVTTTQNFYWRQ